LIDRNEQPYNLDTSEPLKVQENAPIGSIVGNFSAEDPDGDELVYELVQDANISNPFVLSQFGELYTSEVLDFERQAIYPILVRTSDDNGSFQQRIFEVEVLDCFIPVVNTWTPFFEDGGSLFVGGEILDDGGNHEALEIGVLVSDRSISGVGDPGVLNFSSLGTSFSHFVEESIRPSKDWKTVYIRAYAKNLEGISYGLEEKIINESQEIRDYWADAKQLDGAPGWWESPWFGTFYKSDSGWLLHAELGWVYPSPGRDGSLWLWKESLGWVWTGEKLYPFLYSVQELEWMYFYGSWEQKRLLYRYGAGEWAHLDESQDVEEAGGR